MRAFLTLFAIGSLALSVNAKDSLALYLFLLDDCVICQDYTPTLNNLHEEHGELVTFVGLFPNFSSKPEKIEQFAEKYSITFDLQTDYFKTMAAALGATITPEAVLVNVSTDEILYRGRIDNKFVRRGKRRHVVTDHTLAAAIELALADSNAKTEYRDAVGCYINYSDAISKYQLSKD